MDDGVHISSAGTILVAKNETRPVNACQAYVEGDIIGTVPGVAPIGHFASPSFLSCWVLYVQHTCRVCAHSLFAPCADKCA